jgi:hypothetical protein
VESIASSNLTLDEEFSHQHLLPPGSSFMEGSAFMFLAETDEFDISFAQVIFRVGGGKQGVWQVESDTGMLQTTVIISPRSKRGIIEDNDFVSNRSFATDWVGDAQVRRGASEVVWQLAGVTHVCKPPYWTFSGEHNGVQLDLNAAGLGNAVQWKGEWAALDSQGAAGYGQPIAIEGTIRVNGVEHVIKNGRGSRDNFIHTSDLPATYHNNRLSYHWIWCLDPALRAMVYHIPGVRTHSEVNAKGDDVSFEGGETEITVLDSWLDPRTGVQVPTRWQLKMSSPAGKTDLMINGGPRSLYGYLTKTGLSLHVGFLARASGSFTYPDGALIQINDAQSYVEWGRALFPLGSGTQAI